MPGFLLFDLDGYRLTPEERELLGHPCVAGVVLFSRNYKNKPLLRQLTEAIRVIKPHAIIAVDHEGGRVQRFRDGFSELVSMSHWGTDFKQQPQLTLQRFDSMVFTMVHELQSVGVNVNLAPVLDRNTGLNDVIGSRGFGDSPDTIVSLAGRMIGLMERWGMPAVVKHFPGHGAVRADSHFALPVDSRSFQEVYTLDMQPFLQLLGQYSALMPAHIVFPNIDSKPVTFSQFWLHDFLRNQLGYSGLIVSDDLTMQAAACMGSYVERAQLALQAGCDVLVACNSRSGVTAIVDGVSVSRCPYREQRVLAFLSSIKRQCAVGI